MKKAFGFFAFGLSFIFICPALAEKNCLKPEIFNVKAGKNLGRFNFEKTPLKPKQVILTFDDGPDAKTTPKILEILKANCAPASFFVIGEKLAKAPNIDALLVASGNSIGIHSFFHQAMPELTEENQKLDFENTDIEAQKFLGAAYQKFYRFPYLKNTDFLVNLLNSRGFSAISADVDSGDWREGATIDSIQENIKKGLAENGQSGIILMHDNREIEVLALPETLKYLRENNYQILLLMPENSGK